MSPDLFYLTLELVAATTFGITYLAVSAWLKLKLGQ